MSYEDSIPWTALERHTGTAFLASAVLVGIFAILNAYQAPFGGQAQGWAYVAFFVPGLIAAHLGLLGLYPWLRDFRPAVARAGAATAGGAAVVTAAVVPLWLLQVLVLAGDVPFGSELYLLALLGTIGAFAAVGAIVSLDVTGARVLGLLLLVPAAALAITIVGAFADVATPWSTFLLAALQACATLGAGLVLRNAAGSGSSSGSMLDTMA